MSERAHARWHECSACLNRLVAVAAHSPGDDGGALLAKSGNQRLVRQRRHLHAPVLSVKTVHYFIHSVGSGPSLQTAKAHVRPRAMAKVRCTAVCSSTSSKADICFTLTGMQVQQQPPGLQSCTASPPARHPAFLQSCAASSAAGLSSGHPPPCMRRAGRLLQRNFLTPRPALRHSIQTRAACAALGEQ